MDIMNMARYPYVKETVDYIRESGPSIADLNTSSIYQSVRACAVGIEGSHYLRKGRCNRIGCDKRDTCVHHRSHSCLKR